MLFAAIFLISGAISRIFNVICFIVITADLGNSLLYGLCGRIRQLFVKQPVDAHSKYFGYQGEQAYIRTGLPSLPLAHRLKCDAQLFRKRVLGHSRAPAQLGYIRRKYACIIAVFHDRNSFSIFCFVGRHALIIPQGANV